MKETISNTKSHHYEILENKKQSTKVSRERRDYLKRNTISYQRHVMEKNNEARPQMV